MTKSSASNIVGKSLSYVADVNGNFSGYTFQYWHDFHKLVFLRALVLECQRYGHRLIVEDNTLGTWGTLGAVVDFVFDNAEYLSEPESPMSAKDGDLRP
jgi:hypothetical protein